MVMAHALAGFARISYSNGRPMVPNPNFLRCSPVAKILHSTLFRIKNRHCVALRFLHLSALLPGAVTASSSSSALPHVPNPATSKALYMVNPEIYPSLKIQGYPHHLTSIHRPLQDAFQFQNLQPCSKRYEAPKPRKKISIPRYPATLSLKLQGDV